MTTSELFQPLALAAALRVAVVVGAVRSMLIPLTVVLALLPARSMAVPLTDWLAPSLLKVTSPVTLARPDPGLASVASKWTVTGPLYQPSALAAVVGAPL